MSRLFSTATALGLLALTSCADSPTAPIATDAPSALTVAETSFLSCPSLTASSVTGTIGLLGGALNVEGHRFALPPLAVLRPTTFTLTAPASDHVELEIHAQGHDSFNFLLPARISISYDRCDHEVDPTSLTVWHIDSLTGLLLEHMGGLADQNARAVHFSSGHLSGFIIAN